MAANKMTALKETEKTFLQNSLEFLLLALFFRITHGNSDWCMKKQTYKNTHKNPHPRTHKIESGIKTTYTYTHRADDDGSFTFAPSFILFVILLNLCKQIHIVWQSVQFVDMLGTKIESESPHRHTHGHIPMSKSETHSRIHIDAYKILMMLCDVGRINIFQFFHQVGRLFQFKCYHHLFHSPFSPIFRLLLQLFSHDFSLSKQSFYGT